MASTGEEEEKEAAESRFQKGTDDARPAQVMEEATPSPSSSAPADLPTVTGAPGGPLFMRGFRSHPICVRKFQGSCVAVLMAIQAELNDPSIQCADDTDLLVDDLRIVSEEQLIRLGLEKIEEEEADEVMGWTLDTAKQNMSSLSPILNSAEQSSSSGPMLDSVPLANAIIEKSRKESLKKRGRPFDRNVRAAAWVQGEEVLSEESMFCRLKRERETAKRSCTLLSLSSRDRQRLTATRMENRKKLQALNFTVAPVKAETVSGVAPVEKVKDFEVILWIEIGKPTTRQKGQHYLVLGSQMLTTLRDKIYCLSDKIMQKANIFLPSGYFRIGNAFYNDMRDPAAVDYSYPLLKWMHDQAAKGIRGSVNMHAEDMATTQFLDLEFRIGKEYTYCHQGSCKHTLMIRDLRLVHKEDVQNILLYPLLRSPLRVRFRKCTICGIYLATKVTIDDKMSPSSPCCYCDYCYYVQHYSQDGTLLYNDFKVYEYHHD